jgi:FkbH-like protein
VAHAPASALKGTLKITEALRLLQAAPPPSAGRASFFLATGFMPLHLATLLTAHLQSSIGQRRVELQMGLYGDLAGNLEVLVAGEFAGAAVVCEWADLDPRLGLRDVGGWRPADLPDIAVTAASKAEHLLAILARAARRVPLAICLPTLPLPPVAYTPGWLQSSIAAELHQLVADLGRRLGTLPGVYAVEPARLAVLSPAGARLDVRAYLATGFPYRLPHASVVADLLSRLLTPPAAKKGIITDLDNTLWLGILGEDGAQALSWDLDHKSQMHGLYQQLLQALAEAGVLIAGATRADPEVVEAGWRALDTRLSKDCVFPLVASWEPKSHSVGTILRTWGVAPESVLFVDDSPAELAEVKAVYPEIECLHFPTGDESAIYALLEQLRDLCGKPSLSEEDRLRLPSIRRAATLAEPLADSAERQDVFLTHAEQELSLVRLTTPPDPRALELINKTNQFNLNGRRYSEGEWRALLERPDRLALLVSYRDKYGPLGKISVIGGRLADGCLHVDTWVLSCRAFSRRIEYGTLDLLFEALGLAAMIFDYAPTAKNGVARDVLWRLAEQQPYPGLRLAREHFHQRRPSLLFRRPSLELEWTTSKAD